MKDVIKQIRNIEIKTKKLVDGLITGNYISVFRGNGIEFSEIREYVPGDDVRTIDWNVTARFNKPYVKVFIEERDLRVYFILDISASKSFGNIVTKQRKAIELIASLIISAKNNNDNVGLIMFSDILEKFIPAKKGSKHVFKILKNILECKPESNKTDINNVLTTASKIIKRNSIIFLVSDFMDNENNNEFFKPLKILSKKHDIIAIKINDNREKEIPDIGLIELEDPETGEQILVDTSSKEFRENYKSLVSNKDKELIKNFNKNKIDVIEINTDESYEKPLKRFFKIRRHRIYK